MTAAATLKVDRVGKLHSTSANALPGLRAHQLQLALHDLVAHHFHAGQHLWLHLPHTTVTPSPAAPPLPLPIPVWLLVQAWSHASVPAGTTRLQLASSAAALYPTPLVQPGDTVAVQPITTPLLPATAITLRRLVTDDSADVSLDVSSVSTSKSDNGFQPAIDSFISATLLNRPCHLGLTVSVELFNTTQHLIIDAIEPPPPSADPTSPPALYIASSTTHITLTNHTTAAATAEPTDDTQTVDFCQFTRSLIHRTELLPTAVTVLSTDV